jgi:hypothetical protein
MSKDPDVPLTKSAIESEMRRLNREFMFDAANKGQRTDEILAKMKELIEYVKENKEKILDQ